MRAACSGATSPTTGSCAGTRRPARPRVFRKPSNYANGNTRDRQGRLVTAEHGRRVTRTEYDGKITVLMDTLRGQAAVLAERRGGEVRQLDLVHRYDRGHHRQLERRDREQELPQRVYRIDGKTGKLTVATGGRDPAERARLLARRVEALRDREPAAASARIYVFDVTGDGTSSPTARKLINARRTETPDGFRVDVDGNLWCGWGMGSDELDGVRVFNPTRQADRAYRAARTLRQRLLRRAQAQPPVHGGEPLALCALRQHPGRARAADAALPAGRTSALAAQAAGADLRTASAAMMIGDPSHQQVDADEQAQHPGRRPRACRRG